jgi:3-oxoacyl-[acyl-carrier protein] reductase
MPASWRDPMRNVIVTGATRGVGLGIARTLAAAGYRVLGIARDTSSELQAAASVAREAGFGDVRFRSCDLADTGSIAPTVQALRDEYGALYGLVNNAGIAVSGVLTMTRDEQIERMIRLNTLSPILLAKYTLRAMLNQREGRIVNISSIVAGTGYSGLAPYAATKASMVGFTRSLAREVGQLGITVNAVAPGFLDTEMTRGTDGAQRAAIARRSALRRMAGVEDVAAAVAFLLSEQARNITGTTLTVDAGGTA